MAESRAGTGNTQNENVVSGTSRKWKTTGEGKKKTGNDWRVCQKNIF